MHVIYGIAALGMFLYPESLLITGPVAIYMMIRGQKVL